MLDKTKLEYLNREKRYDDICLIFNEEYENILKNFFERNNIAYLDKSPISYYAGLLHKHFGKKYKDVIDILINNFSVEGADVFEEVYAAVTTYNYVVKRLKE